MCRLAVFSTKDDKLVEAIVKSKNCRINVNLIITNRPDSPVIEVAKKYGIKWKCFDNTLYPDRMAHETAIVEFLDNEGIDLIIFAHYMRLITPYFVSMYRNKIVNVHPSLLPAFKGAHGYRDAFDAGVNRSGCTLHYVDEGLDTGDVIMQKAVPRFADDTFESFRNRVHTAECIAVRELVEQVLYKNPNVVIEAEPRIVELVV